MAAEQKNDVEKGLEDIRREVIEARNLVIKTDNLLKNLHAEVKAVGKRQEEFQKRQWVSSAAAYLAFTLFAVGSAFFVTKSASSNATQEKDRLEHQVGDLTAQLDKQKSDSASSAATVKAANDVYKMMTNLPGDERLRGIDALVKLDTTRLSPLERQALTDRAELLRKEVGASAFERGKAAFHRNEMTVAAEELSRYLAMNPPEHEALEASFFLGTAYNQLKKHDKAAPLLARFVAENRSSKNRDYAMSMLAQSYESSGQPDKAAEVARDALGTYPNSQFAGQFRVRLSSAKRAMAATANGDAAGTGAAGTGGAPAKVGASTAPAAPPLTVPTAKSPAPNVPPGAAPAVPAAPKPGR